MTMPMRVAILALSVAASVLCCSISAAVAGKEVKWKIVGDWGAIEKVSQHLDELSVSEAMYIAGTDSLDGRSGSMGISRCGQYEVMFGVQTDDEFEGPKNSDANAAYSKMGGRVVYTRALPSDGGLRPTLLIGGNIEYFYGSPHAMMRSTKFLICPTREEGSRCLTFSLRGFTAALKMVCSKR